MGNSLFQQAWEIYDSAYMSSNGNLQNAGRAALHFIDNSSFSIEDKTMAKKDLEAQVSLIISNALSK